MSLMGHCLVATTLELSSPIELPFLLNKHIGRSLCSPSAPGSHSFPLIPEAAVPVTSLEGCVEMMRVGILEWREHS